MLLPDPQPVHLDKVREHEADAVGQVAGRPGLGACRQVITGRGREVVAQKEAARRVLDAAAHFRHVLHDLPDGRVGDGHVHAADGDHEVEARHNVAAVLHELVEVGKVVLATGMRIVQVDREVAQCIQHGHVQLVVVLRREAGGAQLVEHRRRALERVHDVVHVQVALELHALDLDDTERLGQRLGRLLHVGISQHLGRLLVKVGSAAAIRASHARRRQGCVSKRHARWSRVRKQSGLPSLTPFARHERCVNSR